MKQRNSALHCTPPLTGAKDALQLTTRAIDRRAFHFRNLVVLLVAVALGCGVAALVRWSWRPLVGWLSIVPLCGGFLVLDNFLVSRWQARILAMWVDGALHVEDFAQSILSLRMLPGATLRGMLAMLPASGEGAPVDRLPRPARELLAQLYASFHQGPRDYSVVFSVAYTICVASLAAAMLKWDWRPLVGCLAIPLALLAGHSLNLLRQRRCREIVDRARDAGIDLQRFAGSLTTSR